MVSVASMGSMASMASMGSLVSEVSMVNDVPSGWIVRRRMHDALCCHPTRACTYCYAHARAQRMAARNAAIEGTTLPEKADEGAADSEW